MTPEQILQFEIPTGTPRVYELGPELQVRKAEFLAVPNA
jgi:bisphosphoglycerate-dependent phosphoglycerate mutase